MPGQPGACICTADVAPWKDIRGLVDETWYVDCNVDKAMRRVLQRQIGNGAPAEVARERVTTNDLPNARQIATTKQRADLILPALPLRRHERSF